MKKILCLFSVLTLVLISSCSSDDKNSNSENEKDETNEVLLKSTSYKSLTENRVTSITYEGNKIISKVDDTGNMWEYTYSGNLITKTAYFYDNELYYTMEYGYTNGKLTSQLQKNVALNDMDAPVNHKTVYTHNTDGTISYTLFDVANGVEVKSSSEGILTFKDGNLTKFEYFIDGVLRITNIYEYDTANSPTKNIVGLNLLIDFLNFYSVNNITKKTEKIGSSVSIDSFVYSYDSNNFPIKQEWFNTYGTLSGTYYYTY